MPVRPALVPVRPASAKPTQPGNLPVPQLAIYVIISVKFVLFTVKAGNTAIRPRVGAKRARPIASGETGDPGKFLGTDFTDFTLLHSPNKVQPPPDPSDLLSHEQSGPCAQLMLAHMFNSILLFKQILTRLVSPPALAQPYKILMHAPLLLRRHC